MKLIKDSGKKDPDAAWINIGELYVLTYDGADFIAFPLTGNQNSTPLPDDNTFVVPRAVLSSLDSSAGMSEITEAFGGQDAVSAFVSAILSGAPIVVDHGSMNTDASSNEVDNPHFSPVISARYYNVTVESGDYHFYEITFLDNLWHNYTDDINSISFIQLNFRGGEPSNPYLSSINSANSITLSDNTGTSKYLGNDVAQDTLDNKIIEGYYYGVFNNTSKLHDAHFNLEVRPLDKTIANHISQKLTTNSAPVLSKIVIATSGSVSSSTNWYSSIEDFYYSLGYIPEKIETLKEYFGKYYSDKYVSTIDDIRYTGQPETDTYGYVVAIRDQSTTSWNYSCVIPVYNKMYGKFIDLLPASDYNNYRTAIYGIIDVPTKFKTGDTFDIKLNNCYTETATKIEYRCYSSTSSAPSYTEITGFPTEDNASFTVVSGYAPSITNNLKIDIQITYANKSTRVISKTVTYDSGAVACVLGETPVLTPSGFTKIEDLKIGDEVISKNEITGENEVKSITNIKSHLDYDIYYVITRKNTIKCTNDHIFYVKGKGKVCARNLQAGDFLVTSGGLDIRIESIAYSIEDDLPVYDIAVEDNNNYYISEDCILVYTEDITKNEAKVIGDEVNE